MEAFMGLPWNIVAFPVILPWQEEFWTLPLYFPDLKVGVTPGWPTDLPYKGMPLPQEAQIHPRELQNYQPGEVRQWQAFEAYRLDQAGEENLVQAIRDYGQPAAPQPASTAPNAWSLAWQLEKMQADEDAQLLLVDKGQDWLQDILQPEPWTEPSIPVSGIQETVDPELAQLRYHLWRRVMSQFLQGQAAPLLLGRTSRALFLTLKGWPDWTSLRRVHLALPGCRNKFEWQAVAGDAGKAPWQEKFENLLADLLAGVAELQDMQGATGDLQEFVEEVIVVTWPFPAVWNWDLEIWAADASPGEPGPILCWGGAGTGILPG
jgi:hypothetical protein